LHGNTPCPGIDFYNDGFHCFTLIRERCREHISGPHGLAIECWRRLNARDRLRRLPLALLL